MIQNLHTKQTEEKWNLHHYNFIDYSSTRLSFGRLDVKSDAKQSLTFTGGKRDSLNNYLKN